MIVPTVGVDLLRIVTQGLERHAFLARFRVLKCLEMLNLSPLHCCHLVVKEEVFHCATLYHPAFSWSWHLTFVGLHQLRLAVHLTYQSVVWLYFERLFACFHRRGSSCNDEIRRVVYVGVKAVEDSFLCRTGLIYGISEF